MNTILVWVLVTVGGSGTGHVVYSPPLKDLATCQHLQKSVGETRPQFSRCVQINLATTK